MSSSPEPLALPPEVSAPALRSLLGEMEAELGTRVSIVGGYVRDLLLGRSTSPDVDVVVEGRPAELAADWLRRRWDPGAKVVPFERFGTAQVAFPAAVRGRLAVEFVRARSEAYSPESRKPEVSPGSLEEDAWRRDFTVNALLLRPSGEVLDPTRRGLGDLLGGVLRTPLDPAQTFSEDPLRMLRAARFSAQLGFALAPGVEEAMGGMAPRLGIVSRERVRDELVKLLLAPRPSLGFRELERTGLLAQFAPELQAMSGVAQAGYHVGDVFEHTCLALDAAPARLRVRLAVLFHDVGKPPTAVPGPEGPTFHGHPQAGAELAQAALRRLRFSGAEVDGVARLVQLHMRPIQYRPEWADSAVRRLWHAAGALLPDLMDLARADTVASSFPSLAQLDELGGRLAAVAREHPRGIRPALDGEQLKRAYALPAGPWVGRAQRLLLEAAVEGELPAEPRREQALALLERFREQWAPRPGEVGGGAG